LASDTTPAFRKSGFGDDLIVSGDGDDSNLGDAVFGDGSGDDIKSLVEMEMILVLEVEEQTFSSVVEEKIHSITIQQKEISQHLTVKMFSS
jgi:hypothetical protein